MLKEAQKINKELGYGDNNTTWEQKEYANMMRQLKNEERMKKAKKESLRRGFQKEYGF